MDSSSLEVAKEVFRRFDTNDDKVISRHELKRLLQLIGGDCFEEQQLEDILSIADPSGNGNIDYTDFLSWVWNSADGQRIEGKVEELIHKPEPPLTSTFGKLHVLVIEGSSHPGRLLGNDQFMGLPLHFDMLESAFSRLPDAIVQTRVSPRKSQVLGLVRQFASSVPAGDLSMLIYTGHGVQAKGEQYLVFESRGGVKTFEVEPLRSPETREILGAGEFRLRERMQQIDRQMSEQMGPDWVSQGWTITDVDGETTDRSEYNHAVAQAGRTNQPFEVTFSKGQKTIDFVSYDELRAVFAGGGPSAHFIDACRVVHDDALGFQSDERKCDAVASRQAFLQTRPTPPNVVSVFAVKPGVTAMHEGAGRNYNAEKMDLGHKMEAWGILESDYAWQIEEAWRKANAADGTILQYYTSFFVEAFANCLGELHLEGPTATVGNLLQRITCCPYGRVRKMRGQRTFVGDSPVLEAGSDTSAVEAFAVRFQGTPFVTPEVEDE